MARARTMLSLPFLSSCFLLLLLCVVAESNGGLSIKLIHRDSPESPLYPGNLTHGERLGRLVQRSIAYAHHLAGTITILGNETNDSEYSIANPTMIRPRLDIQHNNYMVEVGIGTFNSSSLPYYKYFLHLDTGSSLAWLQCEDCKKSHPNRTCFRQKPPLFPNSRSRTYRPLPCNQHPLCYEGECINKKCSYSLRYVDKSSTEGFLASETFTFRSNNKSIERIPNLIFGCGINNKGNWYDKEDHTNQIAGILGMGAESRSFVNQIRSRSQGRFSYCLPPLDNANVHKSTIFLRFGADIPQHKGLLVTSLLPSLQTKEFSFYYIGLEGISFGNKRLVIPRETFLRKKNGSGGCVIDTGASFSHITKKAYDVLKATMVKHFSASPKVKRINPGLGFFNLCYISLDRTRLKNLPSITFHLRESNLVVQPEAAYILAGSGRMSKFCLAMFPLDHHNLTIIGAYQQTNKRFIFDNVEHKLNFGPEDCTRGA